MTKAEQARVVVVGAGPAGLVLAWRLHHAGIPVLVLKRQARAALARHKAGLVEHRTVQALYRKASGAVLCFDTTNTH